MAQEQKNVQEQDLNQLRKVRREKLAELQGSGKDPFVITKYDQTHHSVEVKENYEELEGKQIIMREERSWMHSRFTYPSQDV